MDNVDSKIAGIEQIIAYTYVNKALCAEALNMSRPNEEIIINGALRSIAKYERVELIGDLVMATVLGEVWFSSRNHAGNSRAVGDWAQMKENLLSNIPLGARGSALGIDQHIIKNHGMGGSPISDKKMGDIVEAIVGAAFVDADAAGANGLVVVRSIMQHLGLLTHPYLTVTLCDAPPFAF